MNPDVRHHAAFAGTFRIHLPCVALIERLGKVYLAETPLLILHYNLADASQLPVLHKIAGEFHHRISRIGERDSKYPSLSAGKLFKIDGLCRSDGKRLLAHYVHSRLKRSLGDCIVRIVRCAHSNEIDAPLFGGDQTLPVGIDTIRSHTQFRRRSTIGFSITGETACHDIGKIVHSYRGTVHRSYERPFAAAHHCIFQTLHIHDSH